MARKETANTTKAQRLGDIIGISLILVAVLLVLTLLS